MAFNFQSNEATRALRAWRELKEVRNELLKTYKNYNALERMVRVITKISVRVIGANYIHIVDLQELQGKLADHFHSVHSPKAVANWGDRRRFRGSQFDDHQTREVLDLVEFNSLTESELALTVWRTMFELGDLISNNEDGGYYTISGQDLADGSSSINKTNIAIDDFLQFK